MGCPPFAQAKDLVMPTIEGARLTDHYGKQSWRMSPGNPQGWHYGMDIAGITPGSKPDVVAVADGVVSAIAIGGIPFRNGRHVKVTHSGGSAALYNHVGSPYVKVGQRVKRGDRLAPMSNSGTQHVHLHLEWWLNGVDHHSHTNPLPHLKDHGWVFNPTLTDEKDWLTVASDKEIQDLLMSARIPVERSGKTKLITVEQSLKNSDNNDNRFLSMLNEMSEEISALRAMVIELGDK